MGNILPDHSLTLSTAVESTYGVPGTLGGGWEWLETSSLVQDPNLIESTGLRQGSRFQRADRSVPGISRVTGNINLPLLSKAMGLPMSYAMGTGVNTLVSGSARQELFTPVTSTAVMPSFTAQEGIVGADGTIRAFTSAGLTVKSFKLTIPDGGAATLTLAVDGRYKHRYRQVADGATTSGSATVSSATALFGWNDIGRVIAGTGIPAATTIIAVATTGASCTISANATATGSGVTLSIGTAYTTPTYPTGASLFTSAFPSTGYLLLGGTLTVPTTTALGSMSGGLTAIGTKSWELEVDNGLDVKRDVIGGRNNPTTGIRKGTLNAVVEYDGTTGDYLCDAQANQWQVPMLFSTQTLEAIALSSGTTLANTQVAVPVAKVLSGAFPAPTKGDMVKTTLKIGIYDGLVASQPVYVANRTTDTAL